MGGVNSIGSGDANVYEVGKKQPIKDADIAKIKNTLKDLDLESRLEIKNYKGKQPIIVDLRDDSNTQMVYGYFPGPKGKDPGMQLVYGYFPGPNLKDPGMQLVYGYFPKEPIHPVNPHERHHKKPEHIEIEKENPKLVYGYFPGDIPGLEESLSPKMVYGYFPSHNIDF